MQRQKLKKVVDALILDVAIILLILCGGVWGVKEWIYGTIAIGFAIYFFPIGFMIKLKRGETFYERLAYVLVAVALLLSVLTYCLPSTIGLVLLQVVLFLCFLVYVIGLFMKYKTWAKLEVVANSFLMTFGTCIILLCMLMLDVLDIVRDIYNL